MKLTSTGMDISSMMKANKLFNLIFAIAVVRRRILNHQRVSCLTVSTGSTADIYPKCWDETKSFLNGIRNLLLVQNWADKIQKAQKRET